MITHTLKVMAMIIALTLGLFGSAYAQQSSGPMQTPLKIDRMYQNDGTAIFIAFETQAMPSCYQDSGGYLRKSHPNFDQLYAQILTMMAMGGIRGYVLYRPINPGAGQWSDCDIVGFYLFPE